MAAIATTFHALRMIDSVNTIVCHTELYCDTNDFLDQFAGLYKCKIIRVDCSDAKAVEVALRGAISPTVIFVESCSNPSGQVPDWECVSSMPSVALIVDNTWLSSAIFNPLDHGADVVIESLTKYNSSGQAIAGAIIGNPGSVGARIVETARIWAHFNGHHVSPHDMSIISKSLDTLKVRVKAASNKTMQIISALIDHGFTIVHPTVANPIDSLPFKIQPSVFVVTGERAGAGLPAVLPSLSVIKKRVGKSCLEWKTSYGGPHSRIDNYSKKDRIRISIGYNEEPNLLFDLLMILS